MCVCVYIKRPYLNQLTSKVDNGPIPSCYKTGGLSVISQYLVVSCRDSSILVGESGLLEITTVLRGTAELLETPTLSQNAFCFVGI